ncbi:hypothetical protein EDB89DRAFT_2240699 [Lactarius sanguifluus]|nr:hypothetical protein EDB89DRAFT_2240699 [Lactarius sanguifluus]
MLICCIYFPERLAMHPPMHPPYCNGAPVVDVRPPCGMDRISTIARTRTGAVVVTMWAPSDAGSYTRPANIHWQSCQFWENTSGNWDHRVGAGGDGIIKWRPTRCRRPEHRFKVSLEYYCSSFWFVLWKTLTTGAQAGPGFSHDERPRHCLRVVYAVRLGYDPRPFSENRLSKGSPGIPVQTQENNEITHTGHSAKSEDAQYYVASLVQKTS